MNFIYGDVETSTRLPGNDPLRDYGGYRYSVDPSTRIECGALAFNQDEPQLYDYYQIEELKRDLRQLVDYSDCIFVFHYALFELAIFQNKLGIVIPPSRVIDTYMMLGYYGYPRSLEEGAKKLNCSALKDMSGKETMLNLASGLFNPRIKPEEYAKLYRYNITDVKATREIHQMLPPLPAEVQRLWELDVEINMRGVPVDMKAVHNAIVLRDYLKNDADREMSEITGGMITTCGQTERMQKLAASYGFTMLDCGADTIRRTLELPLPEVVRKVLTLRQAANQSSVAKFDQIVRRQVNGRLYHEFDTYGCMPGRPKGRGVQVLNLFRSTEADFLASTLSECPQHFLTMHSRPRNKLAESMRGMIRAEPGYLLLGGDLGQIEARCTGYIADDQKYLDMFRAGDPYCTYGEFLWGHKITSADLLKRTAAKATVLQMGFAGGIGASQRGAEQYNYSLDTVADIILPNATPYELERAGTNYHKYYLTKNPVKPLTERQGLAADILKQRYRKDFERITKYWDELWNAFIYGGDAGRINVQRKGNLRILTLPSDRRLFYHDVRHHRRRKVYTPQREDDLPDDDEDETEEYWTYQARERRKKLWKGVTIENVAQAMNHDISSWYMLRANQEIGPVIHECYDEFTMHIEIARLEAAKKELADLVKTQPAWSAGLPIKFDIWNGERYG